MPDRDNQHKGRIGLAIISLISPLPRLELALCPLIPIELLRCASRNSLFFRIIGVSLSGTGTTASALRSAIPRIDFLVFRTNTPVGGPIVEGPAAADVEMERLGGEAGREESGFGRCDDGKFKKSI